MVFIDTKCNTWNIYPMILEKVFESSLEMKLIVVAHFYNTPSKVDKIRFV